MNTTPHKRHWLLAPFSFLYGIGVGIRNKLFDWHLLPSEEFEIPVISVGNLTVGGTGKTPHTEYLIRLLKDHHKVAFLSRGYKRKSSGYRLANAQSTPRELGDEPYQIWQKFPDIHVAVDANRRRGIHRLCENTETSDTEIVLLDDAYQHRYVVPGINILLMDYSRQIYEDSLMPIGNLREPVSSKSRAQIIIVTKCPEDIKPIDYRIVLKNLELRPYQRLFFTTFQYGDLQPFRAEAHPSRPLSSLTPDTHILLVTGIASPTPLRDKLQEYTQHVQQMAYSDHHDFSHSELQGIVKRFQAIEADDKLIITTDKDAARFRGYTLDDALADHLYQLPIEVRFLQEQQETFNNYITDYVRKNSRNRIIHQRTNAHKS